MIHEWLGEMREAAAHDDAITVARLARLIKDKIEQEQQWQREQEWRWEYGVDDDDDDDAPDVHPVRRTGDEYDD
jgi:hypothetical protein